VDNYAGEIYHDHFRIYDSNNYNIPLVEQMLMFLGFTKEELKNEDTSPMLFFTDTEIEQGENIIKEYFGNEEFCSINLSRRLNLNESNFNKLNNVLTRYKQYKFLYQLSISDKGLLDNVDKGLNL
jgi:hypothetical protein